MMERPTVSLVVLSHDGCEHLDVCLTSLADLSIEEFDLEVIVVDNASTDGTADLIAKRFPAVRVLRSDVNLGFSKGANLGAAHASGEFVAFLNNDMRVDRRWLDVLVHTARGDDRLACVGSAILNWDGTAIDFAGRPEDAFGVASGLMNESLSSREMPSDTAPQLFVSAGAALFRLEAFRDVGGFDPTYFLYHEDVDLCWRLWLRGYRCALAPRSIVYHRGGASSSKLPAEYIQGLAQRHVLLTLVKNLESRNLRDLFPLVCYVLFERWRWSEAAGRALPAALDEFRATLDRILATRAGIQRSRVVSDTTLFAEVGHPFGSLLRHERYRAVTSELATWCAQLDFDPDGGSTALVRAGIWEWVNAAHVVFARAVVARRDRPATETVGRPAAIDSLWSEVGRQAQLIQELESRLGAAVARLQEVTALRERDEAEHARLVAALQELESRLGAAVARLQEVTALRERDEAERARLVAALQEKDAIISGQNEGIVWLRAELAEVRRLRDRTEAVNDSLRSQLDEIFASRGWRWLTRYRRVQERITPRRRRSGTLGRTLPPAPPERPEGSAGPSAPAGRHESLTLLPALSPDEAAALDAHPTDYRHRRFDVVCLSIIDWEFRYQRPQQLMSRFAANGHRVFYVSCSRFRSTEPAAEPAVRLIKDNVYEVQLAAPRPLNVYGEVAAGDGARVLTDSLAQLRRTYDISAAVVYVMVASWTNVACEARARWDWRVVYDCMDEWQNFPGISPALLDAEADLVAQCDLLVVTAARLHEKWKPYGRPTVLARNAVDYDFYATRCRPNTLLTGTRHPIIGYCGAIADWFDIELVAYVARARPQWSFVLLGGVFDVDVRALKALPNVALLGQQPYDTMPQYVYHFDACLIPFKVNPITEATDPVKLYEYLSAGKPVVSVALPELEPYRDLVYLAADREEFLAHLDRATAEQDRELVTRRRAFAATHTWQERYSRITAALVSVVKPASAIVVTYNNLSLTKLCLDSLLRNTDYPNCEIIVVDNASSDGTPAYLRYMEARHPEIRVILNEVNLGFSRANNQGIAASQGHYLVLLNNDTVVPPGWLTRLLHHLRHPTIGLVGPVTNFVGNQAKLEVGYRTRGEMEQFAADRARRFDGQVADIQMLAMFCVAMRRETYERVGPLDERFELGMFEDDDYAQRLRACGYRVVCAADVFVHHVGQAAFKALIANGEYDPLFEKNRRLYEEKWRVRWTRHENGPLPFAPVPLGAAPDDQGGP